MAARWKDGADFVTVYIREAHPTDGWQVPANERDQVCYAQPRSLEERQAIVRDFVKRFDYTVPMLVDTVEDQAEKAYAAWPERLYVIGADGAIAYKGAMGPEGFHPEEVEAWLSAHAAAPRP